jgi:hypothetical protein
MSVIAITPFVHGKADGTMVNIKVNSELSGKDFSEDELRMHIAQGSAVDTSGKLKPLVVDLSGGLDEDTLKRDELLAKNNLPVAVDDGNPTVGNVPQPNLSDPREATVRERIDVSDKGNTKK